MRATFAKTSPMLIGQLTLGVSVLLLVAVAPPAQGRMLLVPLNGEPIAMTTIESAHALALKPGPVSGSWVVDGQRAALAELASEGIIVLAAPDAICGGVLSNEATPS